MATLKRSSSGMYTIHNGGTNVAFYPNKKVIHPFENKETTLLDVHWERVELANEQSRNQKLVYITDENGSLLQRRS